MEITKIDIWREPVDSKITSMLNLITLGKFNPATEKLGYDQLFHLSMVLNGMIRVEKNSVAKVSMGATKNEKGESISVPMHGPIKVGVFFDTAIQQMGEKNFFVYDAFSTNCQLFIKGILRANGLLTSELDNFIYQKAGEILRQLPGYTSTASKLLTDLGSFAGAGLEGYEPHFDFDPNAPEESFGSQHVDTTTTKEFPHVPPPPGPTDGMTPDDYFKFLLAKGWVIQPRGKRIFSNYYINAFKNFTQQQNHMLEQAKFNRDTKKAMEIMATFNKVMGFILGLFPGGGDVAKAITGANDTIQTQLKNHFGNGKTSETFDYSAVHMNALAQNNLKVFKETLSLWNPYRDLLAAIKTPEWSDYLKLRGPNYYSGPAIQLPRAILPPPDVAGNHGDFIPPIPPIPAPTIAPPTTSYTQPTRPIIKHKKR